MGQVGLVLVSLAAIVFFLLQSQAPRESEIIFHQAVVRLANAPHGVSTPEEGFWVGDVTDLYRLGVIPLELAQADTAPLKPVVPTPKPFHGYHVVAMHSAPHPTDWNTQTIPLKGRTRSKDNFAFCIYPIGDGPKHRYVYLVTRMGMFGRPSTSDQPVLEWPTGKWRNEWSIID